jgi:TonB family protein
VTISLQTFNALQDQPLAEPWSWRKIARQLRHWSPSLFLSLLINLLALSLLPLLLAPRTTPIAESPLEVRFMKESPVKSPQPAPVPTETRASKTVTQAKPESQPTPEPEPEQAPLPEIPPKIEPQPSTASAKTEPAPAPIPSKVEMTPAPTAEPPPPPLPKAQPLYKLTRLPAFADKQTPYYPDHERVNGREAAVLAEVFLDPQGKILEIRIMESGGTAFDEAVTSALQSSRFSPGYIDDEPVAVRFQIPFRFELD